MAAAGRGRVTSCSQRVRHPGGRCERDGHAERFGIRFPDVHS
ncbi:hypothetical protein [Microbacterium enclense]|nr:hypothetical protein [Microbacterium enclense]